MDEHGLRDERGRRRFDHLTKGGRTVALFSWGQAVRRFRSKTSHTRAAADRRRHRVRPRVEALEDRRVLAAFTVTTLQDTHDANPGGGTGQDQFGTVSLRSAIEEGNAETDASVTITFAQNLAGTVNLGSALPTLAKSFTIIGPGPSTIVVQRQSQSLFRIFTINGGTQSITCSFQNFGITEGNAGDSNGGGIDNEGAALTLIDVNLWVNSAKNGGGIYSNGGTLTLSGVGIWENAAATPGGYGGGVYNQNGLLTITDGSQIFANTADNGGGIANKSFSANSIRGGSQIYGNTASTWGGGIYNDGQLSMQGGQINDNTAGKLGGGVFQGFSTFDSMTLTDVSVQGNDAAQEGGGFYLWTGTLNLKGSTTLSGNRAPMGPGGVWKAGSTYSADQSCTITDEVIQVP
jgi:hypothetical protein